MPRKPYQPYTAPVDNPNPTGKVPGGYTYSESRITHTPTINYDKSQFDGYTYGDYDPTQNAADVLDDAEGRFPGRYDEETLNRLKQLPVKTPGAIRIFDSGRPNTLLHEEAHALMEPQIEGVMNALPWGDLQNAESFFRKNLEGIIPRTSSVRTSNGITEAMGYNIDNPSRMYATGLVVNKILDQLQQQDPASAERYKQIVRQANYHDPEGTVRRVPNYWRPSAYLKQEPAAPAKRQYYKRNE